MKIETLHWSKAQNAFPAASKGENTPPPEEEPENPQLKRLRDMQKAIEEIKKLPRDTKMTRVVLLKRRLEALKAMLLQAATMRLTPVQIKAISHEVASIAKELASIAKTLGMPSGESGMAQTVTPSTTLNNPQPADSAPNGTQGIEAETAFAGADAGQEEVHVPSAAVDAAQARVRDAENLDKTIQAEGREKGGDPTKESSIPADRVQAEDNHSEPGDDERALRHELTEAAKLLKEIIELLKRRAASGDKETKRNVEAAEKSLLELVDALAQVSKDTVSIPNSYPGVSSAMVGSPAPPAQEGVNVHLTV